MDKDCISWYSCPQLLCKLMQEGEKEGSRSILRDTPFDFWRGHGSVFFFLFILFLFIHSFFFKSHWWVKFLQKLLFPHRISRFGSLFFFFSLWQWFFKAWTTGIVYLFIFFSKKLPSPYQIMHPWIPHKNGCDIITYFMLGSI